MGTEEPAVFGTGERRDNGEGAMPRPAAVGGRGGALINGVRL